MTSRVNSLKVPSPSSVTPSVIRSPRGTRMLAKRVVKWFGHEMPTLCYTYQVHPNDLDTIIVAYKSNLHVKRITRMP